jgi:hypothetical protein
MVCLGSLSEDVIQQLLIYVCQEPIIQPVYELAKEFAVMVRGQQVEALEVSSLSDQPYWIDSPGLIRQDYAAV